MSIFEFMKLKIEGYGLNIHMGTTNNIQYTDIIICTVNILFSLGL